jgi:hypothetical protein
MSAGGRLHYQIIQVETGDVIKHKQLVNQVATGNDLPKIPNYLHATVLHADAGLPSVYEGAFGALALWEQHRSDGQSAVA